MSLTRNTSRRSILTLPRDRGPMIADLDKAISDGSGNRFVVEDAPGSHPLERDDISPGDFVLMYLPKYPRAGDWQDYAWVRVEARYDEFLRTTCGLHVAYDAIVAQAYSFQLPYAKWQDARTS